MSRHTVASLDARIVALELANEQLRAMLVESHNLGVKLAAKMEAEILIALEAGLAKVTAQQLTAIRGAYEDRAVFDTNVAAIDAVASWEERKAAAIAEAKRTGKSVVMN